MSIDRAQPVTSGNALHDLAIRPKAQSVSKAPVASSETAGTQVSLSKLTQAVQTDTTHDINMERLANIKAAMESGELHIDTDKIAHALVQDMLNFS
ncbi:flagellar biosynthesis anti-sigma factor FlgM [Dryocola sp. BD586]|jgi:negative regulator of flagellin synthesis FlgM|uniref:flagellar biosynthesis anti-sigma factor FlgM n=1 Tax=Dryocola sp. BD586 TaxID=3133271 RepID=UPI003F505E46